MRLSSEHGKGWLGLFALAIAVQPVFAAYVVESVGGEMDCVEETVIRAAPMEDGYQRFDYFGVERCYGQ